MSTKYCYMCGETKPTIEFSKNKSKKDGFQDECKPCNRSYGKRGKERKIKFALECKNNECEDCGKPLFYPDNKGEYHFHHVDPSTKVSTLNEMFKSRIQDLKLIEELEKCALLCEPCHYTRHKDFRRGLRDTL